MDETDFHILQAMGFAPYLPDVPPADALKPGRLGKRVGLGVKATKERIARLESAGIIAGYHAFPNLRHFPLQWKSFHFRVPEERKDAFVREAAKLDGYVGRFEFVGRDVCIDLCWRDQADLEARLGDLVRLAGGVSPWEFHDNACPLVGRELSLLDWRIVRALRNDAKRPFAQLAREMRVTVRTIKNRFDRMVGEGSLWVVPIVDFGRIPGFIPFGMLVYARADAPRGLYGALRKALAPDLLYAWAPPAVELGTLGAMVRARTTSGMEEARRRTAALPGVERIELLVPTAVQGSGAWLDTAIDARVAALSKTGPPTNAREVNPPGVRRPR